MNDMIQEESKNVVEQASNLIRNVDFDSLVAQAKELNIEKQAKHEETTKKNTTPNISKRVDSRK